jgi:hypothetical protein
MTGRGRSTRVAAIAVLGALLVGTGCNNIWDWTVDDGSFDALMADGREAIREKEYDRAERKFEQAVDLRPANAEARYYLAKAAVLNGEVDVFSLVRTLTDDDEGGAGAIFSFDVPEANSVYRVNRVVLDNLEPIRHGEAIEGTFATTNVDLDLAVAYTLRGILRLRDTNGDGVIDALDVSLDDLGFGEDENGDWSLEGVDDVPPDDLNDMIDDLNELLDEGGDVLGDVGDDSGFDLEDLEDLLEDVGADVSAFYVNTGVPGNPGEGDNDGDGLVDEECLNGEDDDADGLVDEDSRVAGCPPPAA